MRLYKSRYYQNNAVKCGNALWLFMNRYAHLIMQNILLVYSEGKELPRGSMSVKQTQRRSLQRHQPWQQTVQKRKPSLRLSLSAMTLLKQLNHD